MLVNPSLNRHAARARLTKATALADTLQRLAGGSAAGAADFARDASEIERDMAAKVAGVRPGSAETWALVVELLRAR